MGPYEPLCLSVVFPSGLLVHTRRARTVVRKLLPEFIGSQVRGVSGVAGIHVGDEQSGIHGRRACLETKVCGPALRKGGVGKLDRGGENTHIHLHRMVPSGQAMQSLDVGESLIADQPFERCPAGTHAVVVELACVVISGQRNRQPFAAAISSLSALAGSPPMLGAPPRYCELSCSWYSNSTPTRYPTEARVQWRTMACP